MSVSSIVTSIKKDDNTFYSVKSPNCSGIFIFDIDESSFTDKMKRELMGVLIEVYSGETLVKDRNVLWSAGQDQALVTYAIPTSLKVKVLPVIDERYIKTFPDETLDTTYPVTIKFDDSPVWGGSSGGGGDDPGGDITVLNGKIKDNPTSTDVVTSAQVYEFVMDNDNLVYNSNYGGFNVDPGSGSSSGTSGLGSSIHVLDGNIKDNPTSNDVVTAAQTFDFVTNNENLVYWDQMMGGDDP